MKIRDTKRKHPDPQIGHHERQGGHSPEFSYPLWGPPIRRPSSDDTSRSQSPTIPKLVERAHERPLPGHDILGKKALVQWRKPVDKRDRCAKRGASTASILPQWRHGTIRSAHWPPRHSMVAAAAQAWALEEPAAPRVLRRRWSQGPRFQGGGLPEHSCAHHLHTRRRSTLPVHFVPTSKTLIKIRPVHFVQSMGDRTQTVRRKNFCAVEQ